MDKLQLSYYMLKPTIGYDTAPPGYTNFQKIIDWVGWIGIGVSLVAIVAAGIAIAMGRSQGHGNEHVTKLVFALIGSIVIGAASAFALAVT